MVDGDRFTLLVGLLLYKMLDGVLTVKLFVDINCTTGNKKT